MLRYPRAEYDPESAKAHFVEHGGFHANLKTDWPSVLAHCCDDDRKDEAFEDLARARYRSVAYAFFYLRCGIYVRVRDGKVVRFVPFANPEFRNDWLPADLPFEEWSLLRHAREKVKRGIRYRPDMDVATWWCNGGILCNEWNRAKPWGDTYLPHILELLRASFEEGDDADFMFNKRDYPQLRHSSAGRLLNPYGFIHDREVPERFQGEHLRFLSFYGSPEFSDRLVPTTDDIEITTGDLFPPHFADIRSSAAMAEHEVPWASRKATAFFRGGATGAGVTTEDNTRLHLASLHDGDLLDVGVVAWNSRDKKMRGKGVTFVKSEALPFDLAPFVPVSAQQTYKYVVYADGHCAASRYGSMMRLGALILKVESREDVPGSLWLSPHLRGGIINGKGAKGVARADHLVVAGDLSNLVDTVRWARKHDKEVRAIVRRCRALADRVLTWGHLCGVTRDAVLS